MVVHVQFFEQPVKLQTKQCHRRGNLGNDGAPRFEACSLAGLTTCIAAAGPGVGAWQAGQARMGGIPRRGVERSYQGTHRPRTRGTRSPAPQSIGTRPGVGNGSQAPRAPGGEASARSWLASPVPACWWVWCAHVIVYDWLLCSSVMPSRLHRRDPSMAYLYVRV